MKKTKITTTNGKKVKGILINHAILLEMFEDDGYCFIFKGFCTSTEGMQYMIMFCIDNCKQYLVEME